MKKRLFILGNTLGIFLLCFLIHSVFEWYPNKITSIFFPVNESIWEHMKMIFTSYTLWTVVLLMFYKKLKMSNYLFSCFITSILTITLYLLIYLPIYKAMGENMFIILTLLFVVIFIFQILAFYILNKKECKALGIISLILIPVVFAIFGYLTYNPVKTLLFYDPLQEKYGISTLSDE